MSRFILVPMMLAATLAVTVAGCNRFPDLSIQVTANLQPDATDCGVADDQETVLAAGVIDRAAPAVFWSYVITPRVESYIVSNALEFQGELRDEQLRGLREVLERFADPLNMGGIVRAKPGWGKTVFCLGLVATLEVPTLVVVHKKFLMDQWRERIEKFLPGAKVGHAQEDHTQLHEPVRGGR